MLHALLTDIEAGCHSALELAYLQFVERAHGLPVGLRQNRRQRPGGIYYDDVAYSGYAIIVELDGQIAHPDDTRRRDNRRDNSAVVAGERVLRFGYGDVIDGPCRVARQVIEVLRRGGWNGRPNTCADPRCDIT